MENIFENNSVEAMQERLKTALDNFDCVLAELELLDVDFTVIEKHRLLSEDAKQLVDKLDKKD